VLALSRRTLGPCHCTNAVTALTGASVTTAVSRASGGMAGTGLARNGSSARGHVLYQRCAQANTESGTTSPVTTSAVLLGT
jgi:hypothetical protein